VSRGSHIVVASRFLSGSAAIMVPKTEDGRVIFAIPWQGWCSSALRMSPSPPARWNPDTPGTRSSTC
jgi:glycerol-3-phosphate dehydrogenase